MMPAKFEYDHLLHPITLDSVFHTFIAAVSGSNKSLLPTSMESISISPRLPSGPGAEFSGFAKTFRKGFREFGGSVYMSDESWNEPKIIVKGFVGTEVGVVADQVSSTTRQSSLRKMCAELIWKPEVEHVGQTEAEQLFKSVESLSLEHAASLEKAVTIYIARALATLTPEKEAALAGHLSKYVAWMRQQIDNKQADQTAEDDDKILAEIAGISVEGRLITAIGEKLPGILDGSTPPLPVMAENNMLYDYYSQDATLGLISQWLDLQGHKRPDYRILEVGAGTGSMTLAAVESLGGRHGTTARFSQYCFTDSDPTCFDDAQHLLKDWQGHITFKKLNIDHDPIDQGFEEGSFDVILAANVSHATPSLHILVMEAWTPL